MNVKNEMLTPQEIVKALDKYIIGQQKAKKAIAVALRDRWRKQRADLSIREEITPSNILMKGPTGTGKTELGRRIAKICKVPFVKVEATQYTERGYVGDDVKNMISSLADKSLDIVRKEQQEAIEEKVKKIVDETILNIVIPPVEEQEGSEGKKLNKETREIFLKKIINGELDERMIDIEIKESASNVGFIGGGMIDESMMMSLGNMMNRFMPSKTKKHRVSIKEAKEVLFEEEIDNHLDMRAMRSEAIARAESGIVFIDEVDKITAPRQASSGIDVSREGVQRNLLPIVEGTLVNTKIGAIKTDHILFIAAGAFHNSKPSDLMPEFQGRFPSRVELEGFQESDYANILQKPENSLVKQQVALLKTEGVALDFTEDGLAAIAKAAFKLNLEYENIGARRLRNVMKELLEDISFDVPEEVKSGSVVTVDKAFVDERLSNILQERDASDYVI
jgi:ATP-dependent HslUV protease ATP-binding subunit HslU